MKKLLLALLFVLLAPLGIGQRIEVEITQVGTETHTFAFPANDGAWHESWSAGDDLPDVWVAARALGDSAVIEVEISNASCVVGKPARKRVNATVSIRGPPGYTLQDPYGIRWPTTWPEQRSAFRRFGLVRDDNTTTERRVNEYVLGRRLSAWPDRALRFGPANLPLPTLSASQAAAYEARDSNAFAECLLAVRAGQPWHYEDWEDGPVRAPIVGWGSYWGSDDRAAPAGSGVQFARGYQRNEHFARLALLASMLCDAGQRVQYDRATGRPLSVEDYPSPSPDYKPGSGSTNDRLPEWQGAPAFLPEEFDPAHQIREVGWWICGWEMTGSPACARMILGQAEEQRLIYSDRGPQPAYGYAPENVRNWITSLELKPHWGYAGSIFGRQIGWSLWVEAMALKIDPTNNGLRTHVGAMDHALHLAAMPSGIVQRMHSVPLWNDSTHDSFQAFEVAILDFGWYAGNLQAGLPVPPEILTSAHSLYDNGPRPGGGPYHFTYCRDAVGGLLEPPYALGKGSDDGLAPGDPTHVEALLGLCHAIDGDEHWLSLGARFGLTGTTAADWRTKQEVLEKWSDLGWPAIWLAQAQRH